MLVVKDMTKMFRKEILLYSFFDVSLSKPIRLKMIVYTILFGLIWTLPLVLLMLPLNVYEATFAILPAIIVGNLVSQPIFGGKSFLSWTIYNVKFLLSPKRYYDGKGIRNIKKAYKIDNTYTVSRRKDYHKLVRYIQNKEIT